MRPVLAMLVHFVKFFHQNLLTVDDAPVNFTCWCLSETGYGNLIVLEMVGFIHLSG